MDDFHIKLSDTMDGGERSERTGVTEAVTVLPIAEYELCGSAAGSVRLTWI